MQEMLEPCVFSCHGMDDRVETWTGQGKYSIPLLLAGGPHGSPWSYYHRSSGQLRTQSFPYDARNQGLKEGAITQVTMASGR